MTSGKGIVKGKSSVNLANGVGISLGITVSFTLAIVTTIETSIAKISTITNSTIARNKSMTIIYSSYNTIGSTMSNLANGVGISISLRITVSFPLAIISTIETSIAKISTVTNSTIARNKPITIIYSSYNTIGSSISNLANGVGISISISLRLTVSFTLAIISTIETSIASIANPSDNTRVVSTTRSNLA